MNTVMTNGFCEISKDVIESINGGGNFWYGLSQFLYAPVAWTKANRMADEFIQKYDNNPNTPIGTVEAMDTYLNKPFGR